MVALINGQIDGGYSPTRAAWTAYADGLTVAGNGNYWAITDQEPVTGLVIAALFDAHAQVPNDIPQRAEFLSRWEALILALRDYGGYPWQPSKLAEASQDEGVNEMMMAACDSLYFYLKVRLESVTILYGEPPAKVPASPSVAGIFFGLEPLALPAGKIASQPVTAAPSDPARVLALLAQLSQLTTQDRAWVLATVTGLRV